MARLAAHRPVPVAPPVVVSIGNLALGGTGKTPVTAQLALDLAATGYRGAVLTRGFGSPLRGPLVVAAQNSDAGDEARLLAGVLAPCGWPVVQARHRPRGLAWLLAQVRDLDIILLEDAHQTAGMGRHLDIVILDCMALRGAGRRRAPGTFDRRGGAFRPLARVRRGRSEGRDLAGRGQDASCRPDRTASWWPASRASFHLSCPAAVARWPGRVAVGHRPAGGIRGRGHAAPGQWSPSLAIRCADHEPYGTRLRASIDELLREVNAALVVTTAKDLVKLAPVWGTRAPLAVLEMQVLWEGDQALPDLVRERLDVVRHGEAFR